MDRIKKIDNEIQEIGEKIGELQKPISELRNKEHKLEIEKAKLECGIAEGDIVELNGLKIKIEGYTNDCGCRPYGFAYKKDGTLGKRRVKIYTFMDKYKIIEKATA